MRILSIAFAWCIGCCCFLYANTRRVAARDHAVSASKQFGSVEYFEGTHSESRLASSLARVLFTQSPAVAPLFYTVHALHRPHRQELQTARRISTILNSALEAEPKELLNLLCQNMIVTKLGVNSLTRNALVEDWLESFVADHTHLHVERTSARGDTPPLPFYRGMDGMRSDWDTYLRTMLRTPPIDFTVTLKRDAPPGSDSHSSEINAPPQSASRASPGLDEQMSVMAARRNNPFLKKKKPTREWIQTIEPLAQARQLITLGVVLAGEWCDDLKLIAKEGDLLLRCTMEDEEECRIDPMFTDAALPNDNVTEAFNSISIDLPPSIYESVRRAGNEWRRAEIEEVHVSTLFRTENFDLLQRAVSRQAAAETLLILGKSEGNKVAEASAIWLRSLILQYASVWDTPRRNQLGCMFLLHVFSSSPTVVELPDGEKTLADPSMVANILLERREIIAEAWSNFMEEEAPKKLQGLLTEFLEEQLEQGTEEIKEIKEEGEEEISVDEEDEEELLKAEAELERMAAEADAERERQERLEAEAEERFEEAFRAEEERLAEETRLAEEVKTETSAELEKGSLIAEEAEGKEEDKEEKEKDGDKKEGEEEEDNKKEVMEEQKNIDEEKDEMKKEEDGEENKEEDDKIDTDKELKKEEEEEEEDKKKVAAEEEKKIDEKKDETEGEDEDEEKIDKEAGKEDKQTDERDDMEEEEAVKEETSLEASEAVGEKED